MVKRHAFDDALAPLRALNWQELPPAEQRALFAQLTEVLVAMMERDRLPEERYRRTNVERARRAGENTDKLALIRMAYESLIVEGLDDEQLRQLLTLSQGMAYALDAILHAGKPLSEREA